MLPDSDVHRLPLAAVGGTDWGVRIRAGRQGQKLLVRLGGCMTLGAVAMVGALEEGGMAGIWIQFEDQANGFAAGLMWRG